MSIVWIKWISHEGSRPATTHGSEHLLAKRTPIDSLVVPAGLRWIVR